MVTAQVNWAQSAINIGMTMMDAQCRSKHGDLPNTEGYYANGRHMSSSKGQDCTYCFDECLRQPNSRFPSYALDRRKTPMPPSHRTLLVYREGQKLLRAQLCRAREYELGKLIVKMKLRLNNSGSTLQAG